MPVDMKMRPVMPEFELREIGLGHVDDGRDGGDIHDLHDAGSTAHHRRRRSASP